MGKVKFSIIECNGYERVQAQSGLASGLSEAAAGIFLLGVGKQPPRMVQQGFFVRLQALYLLSFAGSLDSL